MRAYDAACGNKNHTNIELFYINGGAASPTRVELSMGGERTDTFWIHHDAIVATDSNGARSYAFGNDV